MRIRSQLRKELAARPLGSTEQFQTVLAVASDGVGTILMITYDRVFIETEEPIGRRLHVFWRNGCIDNVASDSIGTANNPSPGYASACKN